MNQVTIRENERFELALIVSPRFESSTTLTNQEEVFVGVVKKTPRKWKRFWKQLAIYLGVTVAVGAAAEG